MKKNLSLSILTLLTGLVLIASLETKSVWAQEAIEKTAEPLAQCAALASTCFSKQDAQQISNCLYSAANHAFCEGTMLGKLTFQRWIMSSPAETKITEQRAVSFLGPQTVDSNCIQYFDRAFQKALNEVETLEGNIPVLQKKLTTCSAQKEEL